MLHLDQKVNYRDYLTSVLGIREQHGDEWTVFCFNPEHRARRPHASIYVGEDTTRKLSNGKTVHRLQGMWICYSCGSHGRVTPDGISCEPSFSDLLDYIDRDLEEPDAVRIYPEAWLDIFTPHPYWKERGISYAAQRHFKLGWDYETDCVTIPVRDHRGRVLGVCRRRLDGGQPKYSYPKGVRTHDLLFGYHELGDDTRGVVLVEGAVDQIALWEAGVPALGVYGSRVSDEQVRLLRACNPLYVCLAFDMDAAGEQAADHFMTLELPFPVERARWDPEEGKDVAALDVVRRVQVVEQAEILVPGA